MLRIFILIAISNVLFFQAFGSEPHDNTDSLLIALSVAKSDHDKARINAEIAQILFDKSPESMERYAVEAINLYKKMEYVEEAVETALLLAASFKAQGYFDKAVRIIQETLDGMSEKNHPSLFARCNITMGELCRAEENFESGINYLTHALRIIAKTGNLTQKAQCFNRLSAIYFEKDNFKLALKYADSSLIILRNGNDYDLILNNLDILGATYRSMKNFQKALQIHDEALKIVPKLEQSKAILSNLYRNIATTYYYMGNYNKSIENALVSYELAEKEKTWVYMENAAINLYYSYSHLGDYKTAFKYSEILRDISKVMHRRQMNFKISELNAKFETAQKERLIIEQKNELQNKQLQLENKKTQQKLLLFGIGGLLAIVVLLAIIYYQKRRDHSRALLHTRIITNKNAELEQLTEEIMAQSDKLIRNNEKLVQLTDFKESMTNMMVHDLKNPLAAIIGFSALHPDDRHFRFVHESATGMLNLVSNILDVQKYEKTEMQLEQQFHALSTLLQVSLDQVMQPLETANLSVQTEMESDYVAYFDFEIISRVMVNLLTNATKYSPSKGVISINAKKAGEPNKEFICISIHNNGEAVPADKIETIFEKYTQINPKKLGVSYSTGIGLSFCRIAIHAHKGEIGVESGPEKGTKFWFTLPAYKY